MARGRRELLLVLMLLQLKLGLVLLLLLEPPLQLLLVLLLVSLQVLQWLLQWLLLKLGLVQLQWLLLLLLMLLLLLASLALQERGGRKSFPDLGGGGRKKFCDSVLGKGGDGGPDWGVHSLPLGEVSLTGALLGGRQKRDDGRGRG